MTTESDVHFADRHRRDAATDSATAQRAGRQRRDEARDGQHALAEQLPALRPGDRDAFDGRGHAASVVSSPEYWPESFFGGGGLRHVRHFVQTVGRGELLAQIARAAAVAQVKHGR